MTNNPSQVEPVEGLAEDDVLDAKAAALVAATEHGVPADVLECLTTGGSLIPPNAIDSMVRAVLSSRITQQPEEVARLKAEDVKSIHTCHDKCDRLPCVQQREIARLRHDLEECGARHWTRVRNENARLRAENERLKRLEIGQWFYPPDGWDQESCMFSPDEVIDYCDLPSGSHVVEVNVATPLPSIWCAVHVTDDEDADERFTFTEHDSEAAARAALNEQPGGEGAE